MTQGKRSRQAIRERNKAKKQDANRRTLIQLGIALLVVVVIGALAYYGFQSGNSGPEVAQERLELDPVLGNPDATVTIVEYGAYGCEACQSWHEAGVVEQIIAQYGGLVNYVYRDLPIINPTWSQAMAEIAQCALDQGNDAYWTAHEVLFTEIVLGRTSQRDAVELVGERSAGIDLPLLRSCVENNTHFNTVRYDMERGEVRGVRGTPTWFINGQQVYNASPQVLTAMIDAALNN